jgi:hypothetical protein
MSVDVEGLAYVWHILRKKIEELEEAAKKALQENQEYIQAKAMLATIDGKLTAFLQDTKQKNAGTKYGTIHTVTRHNATLFDPQEFLTFVRETDEWDMLDKKANATAVREWAEKHKTLPPGVRLSASTRLSITAPKEPI